eukprot:398298-Alexandrium_andersonii.AAC.1
MARLASLPVFPAMELCRLLLKRGMKESMACRTGLVGPSTAASLHDLHQGYSHGPFVSPTPR